MAIANYPSIYLLAEERGERETPIISANLVSQTAGRVRIRLSPNHRQSKNIALITQTLNETLGIEEVRTNPQTGSITILYDIDKSSFEEINALLQTLGITLLSPKNSSRNNPYQSAAAAEVTTFLGGVDRQVNRATDGAFNLRFLIPLGFGVLAVRQLLVKGLALDIIPWYVLAWYAFDSFIKLHYTGDP
ncbi:MAG: HMA2 domain-containing protein [Spirulina sp.]